VTSDGLLVVMHDETITRTTNRTGDVQSRLALDMPAALLRRQQVLADALDQNLAIGVRAAVADHLGRAPTRAELTAARRAAHSLAGDGRAQLLHVPASQAA
jgi:glycerophosphoryl diester phosphodiesterase